MQPKKSTFLDFTRRTDALASQLGIRVGDLPERLKLSRASLFNYRSGKTSITAKALAKLARAEREAGIAPSLRTQLRSGKADQNDLLASASLEEVLTLLPKKARERLARNACEAYLDSVEIQLRGFFLNAQALASMVKSKRPDRAELAFFADRVEAGVRPGTMAWESLARELRRALELEPQLISEQMRTSRSKARSPKPGD